MEKDTGKKKQNKRQVLVSGMLAVLAALQLAACSGRRPEDGQESEPPRVNTGYVIYGPDSFDSADTAVFISRDAEAKTVTLFNLTTGKYYTLRYDGTTKVYDKYKEALTLSQISEGDLVDVEFLKSTKHLTTLMRSKEAWTNENVSKYEMDTARGEVTIGSDTFKMTKVTHFFSNGQRIEEMDLNASDVLNFQGIGNQVLSVSVEKGHGYLRLLNDAGFVGGFIEIGQTSIHPITEDMLLVVPEGNYQVNIRHRGSGGVKSVTILRNEETDLDIGDLEIAQVQTGTVLFSVSPSNAKMYIDSEEKDISEPVSLEYGIHQMIVKADGYKSITQYIRVGQPSAGINVVLESMTESDKKEDKDKAEDDSKVGNFKVYVEAPEQAEVYLDGNYVGISPCSFKKQAGAHVITLRKTGYTTRSYTVQVDSEEKDLTYSFADLAAAATVSGDGDE